MSDINILSFDSVDIEIDKYEAYRYLGLKRDYDNPEFTEVYNECLREVRKNTVLKAVYRKSSLSFGEGDMIHFDFCSFESSSLKKNLRDCKYVYVFAATVGIDVDRLLLKYKKLSPLNLMTADAIASSAVECLCDRVDAHISQGKITSSRFSLGYGDTKLCYQKDLLSFLEADKILGITLNDSMMMTPVKSVTAFIGVKE